MKTAKRRSLFIFGMEYGFTRVELLAITVVLALLGLVLSPAMASGKSEADVALCLNNQRQLINAWQTFTLDNNERMPGTIHGGFAQAGNSMLNPPPPGSAFDPQLATFRPWATGWLTWDLSPHNTNSAYLTNPAFGSLANYLGRRKEVFKCPADLYMSGVQRQVGWKGRVRTYSANLTVGDGNGGPGDGPWNTLYLKTKKLSELVYPPPSSTYVYLEEHPDSMNDTSFFGPYGSKLGEFSAIDIPANFHDGACTFSFGDGHVELHRWSESMRITPITTSGLNVRPNYQRDMQYLFARTPKTQP
jgi:prepilin-type processing-associated H-X9-DG protein